MGPGTAKVVLTHVAALRTKYGGPGVAVLRSALRTLVRRDADRGLETAVLDVSSRSAMGALGLPLIEDAGDHQAFRVAVAAVHSIANPDYVMLLGGPDVVPLVPLIDPMPAPDPDPDLPSDLPYACPGSTELDPTTLVGPTAVVGRLPDLPGATGTQSARQFAAVIRAAARWSSDPPAAYADPLCLSTARWQLCTSATLGALDSAAPAPQLAPPRTAPWTPTELARKLHLVNLHGATADPTWLGDPGFAPVIGSNDLGGLRRLRGFVLAESCFAAEVWDPALASGARPLPLAYLAAGAYGLVGPTCISYGGRTSPDAADILIRMVGEEVLAGASLGRALLSARQRYVAAQPEMSPVDLKTLAQFSLLGDPSIQPVAIEVLETRAARRSRLATAGAQLSRTAPVAVATTGPAPSGRRTFRVLRGRPARIEVTVRKRRQAPALRVREERQDASGVVAVRELESR